MAVRVVHGANAGVFHVAGESIAVVRQALREVFNIPADATAFIDGVPSRDETLIQDNEVLEFLREEGLKGLGVLLTPEDLQQCWKINKAEYEELLVLGLPTLQFGTGVICHPETAIDEFMRQLGDRNQPQQPELVGTPYVADRLGCSTVWVTQMVRKAEIPPACVVPGTGNGKPWKFFRVHIDEWIRRR